MQPLAVFSHSISNVQKTDDNKPRINEETIHENKCIYDSSRTCVIYERSHAHNRESVCCAASGSNRDSQRRNAEADVFVPETIYLKPSDDQKVPSFVHQSQSISYIT